MRHNLDPAQSEVGIGLKALVGLVFANHTKNGYLIRQAKQLATYHGVDDVSVAAADGYLSGSSSASLGSGTEAALRFASKIAPSPRS